MSGNRKAAQALCLELVEELVPGGKNQALYRRAFAAMDDAQFERWIEDLEAGRIRLSVVVPNFSEESKKVSVAHLLEVGRRWGHNFFERIWLPTPDGGVSLSNHAYLILELTFRRQAQILEDKISIPKDNATIDELSGQPTGASKGSRLSYPELQVLANLDLTDSLTEQIKYRGGDIEGFRAMLDNIHRTGEASQEELDRLGTEVEVKRSLSTLLTSMHLRNNL